MAQIFTINEFIRQYKGKLEDDKLENVLDLKPGQKYVLRVDYVGVNDVVFIRVTKHHIACMTTPEYNGIF